MTLWIRLYNQLRAIEITRGLNERGTKVVRYIERRIRRELARAEHAQSA